MRKKIYRNTILLVALAIIMTAGFLLFSFYNFYSSKEKHHLKSYANILATSMEESNYNLDYDLIQQFNSNVRISLIASNGQIIYDSLKNSTTMENHLNRKEVQDAIGKGRGESIRYSTTLEKNTYYYAILLANKNILRLALETNNILSVFLNILPIISLVILILFLISIFVSSYLSRKILAPIESITQNMDNLVLSRELNTIDIYDELLPFVKTLVKQREEIKLHMDNITEKANIMDTITRNMQEGLLLIDKDKYIISANESSIFLLDGNPNKSYLSQSFIKLSRDLELNEAIEDALRSKSNRRINLEINNNFLDIFINPIVNKESLVGLVILLFDSTEEYKANLIRREFSANVSHELKTPLTSINGYAEMIENDLVRGEDVRKFAAIIGKEGKRLLNLIDSIIKLSKIESSPTSSDMEYLDIYPLGQNIVSNLNILARDKELSLNLKGSKAHIFGNQIMIEELIYNLLDNGIKYTNPGGKVDLEILQQGKNTVIRVSDNGMGIAPNHQDRIFERFFMVDKSRSKKDQSSGLGLSIVKHIVDYHRATIELKSEEGKGTEITVTFPFPQ